MDAKSIAVEEERIRAEVRQLEGDQRSRFYREFEEQVKDPDTYAVLNYLFISGLHHFYLGRWLRGAINLSLFVIAVAFLLNQQWLIGLGIIAAVSIVELYALFRSQLIVQDFNNRLMRSILAKIK